MAPGPIHRTDFVDKEGNLLASEIMTPKASEGVYMVVGQSLALHPLAYRVAAVRFLGSVQRVTLVPCRLCPYCGGIQGEEGEGRRYGCVC